MPDPVSLLVSARQLAATEHFVYLLDEHGVVWHYSHMSSTWSRLPDLPVAEEPVG